MCPAKVNHFLAVGKKDAIGYHPLRTIFQAVSLFDELFVRLREGEDAFIEPTVSEGGGHRIACDWPNLPTENTLTKALRLASEFVILPPLEILLRKRIPAQSGLGGGSSDAAGLLRALPRLGVNILPAQQLEVAAAVGADVSFFMIGGRAKAEGYGERLTSVPTEGETAYVIARPDLGCATGPMYAALDELEYPWRDFPEGDELYNDFERVAPCESLDLIEALLSLGARDAALSGSGSAVFGRFFAWEQAQTARDFMVERLSCQAWTAKSLDGHAFQQLVQ